MYRSQDLLKTLVLEWGSNPQPHISNEMLELPVHLAPWEQGGGGGGGEVEYASLME